jgi:hypothetical protein
MKNSIFHRRDAEAQKRQAQEGGLVPLRDTTRNHRRITSLGLSPRSGVSAVNMDVIWR